MAIFLSGSLANRAICVCISLVSYAQYTHYSRTIDGQYNLLKADCTIDKTALEKQLAEKTTPAEIIEVFKAFL